jgi:hypothetical protein
MIDMTLSPDAAKQETFLGDQDGGPKYPYGLSLYLDNDTLNRLGIQTLPAVGAQMSLTAICKVTSVGADEDQSGMVQRVNLQITAMEISEAEKTPAQSIYKNMKP